INLVNDSLNADGYRLEMINTKSCCQVITSLIAKRKCFVAKRLVQQRECLLESGTLMSVVKGNFSVRIRNSLHILRQEVGYVVLEHLASILKRKEPQY